MLEGIPQENYIDTPVEKCVSNGSPTVYRSPIYWTSQPIEYNELGGSRGLGPYHYWGIGTHYGGFHIQRHARGSKGKSQKEDCKETH